jgi:ABC-2 type transport system ATP-binding protein
VVCSSLKEQTMGAIEVQGLTKNFGDLRALDSIDLDIEEGTVYGLLGPNGAGKTTAVRILTTLLKPDSGRAMVAGFDVVTQAEELRHAIGLAGQYAAVDEILTGFENLEMVARLYGFTRRESRRRANELLERFELDEAGDRQVKTYSGGMRRRLDLAASLVGDPRVLFLDEPTTGLDPRSRFALWETIEHLVDGGTTLMLTTQYLEEADRLAHLIGVIDHGQVIAEGTSDELKTKVGGEVLRLEIADPTKATMAIEAVAGVGSESPRFEAPNQVVIPVSSHVGVITDAVRRLDAAGILLSDLAITRPTLDDVFMTLTGHHAGNGVEDEEPATATQGERRSR